MPTDTKIDQSVVDATNKPEMRPWFRTSWLSLWDGEKSRPYGYPEGVDGMSTYRGHSRGHRSGLAY